MLLDMGMDMAGNRAPRRIWLHEPTHKNRAVSPKAAQVPVISWNSCKRECAEGHYDWENGWSSVYLFWGGGSASAREVVEAKRDTNL